MDRDFVLYLAATTMLDVGVPCSGTWLVAGVATLLVPSGLQTNFQSKFCWLSNTYSPHFEIPPHFEIQVFFLDLAAYQHGWIQR
jgi:hypothetical protein